MPIIDARYYKTLVICPNRSMSSELAPLLSQGLPLAPITNIQSYPTRRQLLDLIKTADPKLCFLDFTEPGQAFTVLADLHQLSQTLPVVALLPSGSADLMLKCVRQGAADLLVRPFTGDQMDSAVEKIARLNPPPAPQRAGRGGKVIAVFPAKGACGASTVASSLAFQARRTGAKRVLLCDLDPLTGTISFLLKLKAGYSFLDVLTRLDLLDSDLWKQMIVNTQNIDVLLAPEHVIEGLDELQNVAPIVEFAQTGYDATILDCGGPYGQWNISCARAADDVVLLTTNELASLQAAQRTLIYFDHHRIDTSKIRIVVNRYDKDIGLQHDAISSALCTEVCQVIPSDWDTVQRSLIEGKPIPAGSAFGKSITALTERLLGYSDKGDPGKKSLGLMSIFSRASS